MFWVWRKCKRIFSAQKRQSYQRGGSDWLPLRSKWSQTVRSKCSLLRLQLSWPNISTSCCSEMSSSTSSKGRHTCVSGGALWCVEMCLSGEEVQTAVANAYVHGAIKEEHGGLNLLEELFWCTMKVTWKPSWGISWWLPRLGILPFACGSFLYLIDSKEGMELEVGVVFNLSFEIIEVVGDTF